VYSGAFFDKLPFVINNAHSYNLSGDTIWIYGQVLCESAPAGYYTGLKIKDGEISFSETPVVDNNKLTINSSNIISVKLSLNQPAVITDDTSDYGKDARAATLNLPQSFNFHFFRKFNCHNRVCR